ncbi:MAG: hypothetical protein N3F10_03060 [Candidatus Bathyarchaeota archaeon]|nr:hypothetical protein [Candidatus Bathyarchaeota archaeon]
MSSKSKDELLREIRKLEARLNDFLKEEASLIESIKKFMQVLRDACERIDRITDMEQLKALRLEIAQALNTVLKGEGEAQHERSHLLESYGALNLALEKVFNDK